MTKIRRQAVLLLAVVVMAMGIGQAMWRRTHRQHFLVCIGGCDYARFKSIQDTLAHEGIPLANDGIVDVGMTSLMIAPGDKDRALSAIRDLQKDHPNYNVDLIDEADVAYHFLRYQSAVIASLRSEGITVLPEYVEQNTLVYVKVAWKDKEKAIAILRKLRSVHPEYGLELFSDAGPNPKLIDSPLQLAHRSCQAFGL